MDDQAFLQHLLRIENEEQRRELLQAHAPLDAAFFRLLKDRARELVERDSREALRATGIGLEAAKFAAEQEGVAWAWWARGNAFLLLGRYEDSIAAYSTAISVWSSLDRREEAAQLQSNTMLALIWTGRHAEAQAMGQQALEIIAAQGEGRPLANLLLNLGICALHQGDHAGALAQSQQAAAIFARLGDADQAARCRVNQSIALRNLDRFAEAKSLLGQALDILAEGEAWAPWARAALNLGLLHARLAEHQAALGRLEESRRAFLRAGIEMDAAVVDLYRAQCLLDLNLLPAAAEASANLVETFTRLQMPRQTARAASLLAQIYARQGQREQALAELSHARRIFAEQGDAVETALLDLRRAALLRERGLPGAALRLASQAADALDGQRHPLRHADAHLLMAGCCEDLGRIEEAQLAYRVAWAAGSRPLVGTEPPPYLAYRIAHARGTIAEAAGRRALARGEYDRAVDYLNRVSRGLCLDELRSGYLADKRAVYEAALRLALEDGRLADAFRYSELARAGALRDVLAGRRPTQTQAAGEGLPPDLELEELKARWAWRVSRLQHPVDLLAEAEEGSSGAEDRAARLRELAALERELAAAYRRRRLAAPHSAILEQGAVLTLDQVRCALPETTALLAFDHVGDVLWVFVVGHDAATALPLGSLAGLRWETAALGHALAEVSLFDDPADRAMLQADLLTDLQALYRALLARPLAQLGPQVRRLWLVPCDVLRTLPLAAAHDGQGYLLERYRVSYLPSASLLAALPRLQPKAGARSLVLAHSWEGRLPGALDDGEAVARRLARCPGGNPLLLTEEQAGGQALRRQAASARLLHIAAHGAFRAQAPLFSGLHLADGPLTVHDIYDLDLSGAALVTLSGCQTGLGQGRGGEVLGLTHAFFFAGAATLVVSNWRVEDSLTVRLMDDFYLHLTQGQSPAEALRLAQLRLLAEQPHAGRWAAFSVWGRGFDALFDRRDTQGGNDHDSCQTLPG